jgi:hypothetical protein
VTEDKLIDPLAIRLAIQGGQRKIRLTSREQSHAIELMRARGHNAESIAACLDLPVDRVRGLAA